MENNQTSSTAIVCIPGDQTSFNNGTSMEKTENNIRDLKERVTKYKTDCDARSKIYSKHARYYNFLNSLAMFIVLGIQIAEASAVWFIKDIKAQNTFSTCSSSISTLLLGSSFIMGWSKSAIEFKHAKDRCKLLSNKVSTKVPIARTEQDCEKLLIEVSALYDDLCDPETLCCFDID